MSISRAKAMLKSSLDNQRPKRVPRTPIQAAIYYCNAGLDQDGFESRFVTTEKGLGVFSLKPFQKGDFLLEYCGSLSKASEKFDKSIEASTAQFPRYYSYYFKYDGKYMCIDARNTTGRLGHLANDAKDGSENCNAVMKMMKVGGPRLCLFARRDISTNEELHYDYGDGENLWWRKSQDSEIVNDSDDESVENPFSASDTESSFGSEKNNDGTRSGNPTDEQLEAEIQGRQRLANMWQEKEEKETYPHEVSENAESTKPSTVSLQDLTFSGLKKRKRRASMEGCANDEITTKTAATVTVLSQDSEEDSADMDSSDEYVPDSATSSSDEDGDAEFSFTPLLEKHVRSVSQVSNREIEKSSSDDDSDAEFTCAPLVAENHMGEESQVSSQELEVPKSGLDVQQSRTNGKRLAKRHPCYFCGKMYPNIARHLSLMHNEELEVAKILALPSKSKQRRLAWDVLVKKGDFSHNFDVLDKGHGTIVPKYRSGTKPGSPSKFVPCQFCRGMYGRRKLWSHQKRCAKQSDDTTSSKRTRAVAAGRLLLPVAKGVHHQLHEHIIMHMKKDEVTKAVQKDDTLLLFGARLIDKHGHRSHRRNHISQKLRELGRMLVKARKMSSIKTIEDCLDVANWDSVIEATKAAAGFNNTTKKYGTPSLALKIGHSLSRCAALLCFKALQQKEDEKYKSAKNFTKMYKMGWEDAISSRALATLSEDRFNKMQMLPLVQDVVRLNTFLEEKAKSLCSAIGEKPELYSDLAKTCLAQVILFNRKRSGEAERMPVDAFQQAQVSKPDNSVEKSLTLFERQLCQSHTRIEILGKRDRKVAVLLTKQMQSNIKVLISARKTAGVSSKFLFGRPGLANSPYRGSDSLRHFAIQCGAAHPERLTSTKLRKQLATLAQVLNLTENHQDILATFQGHDIRVHREYYRLPEGTLQVAKVAKLLHCINDGTIDKYRGQNFDEIAFDESAQISDESDSEATGSEHEASDRERGSDDDDDSVLKRTKQQEKSNVDKKGKRCRHQPWSKQEKQAVIHEFKDAIKKCCLAGIGKLKCENLKRKHQDLLKDRSWIQIKSCVKNLIERNKKGIFFTD